MHADEVVGLVVSSPDTGWRYGHCVQIDNLVSEGHLYSTIDDNHFKSTSC